MASVLFGNTLDMTTIPNPLTGFIVAYDLDGVLKQKDEFGIITEIGDFGSSIPSLDSVMTVSNITNSSLIMGLSTDIKTNNGNAKLSFDESGASGSVYLTNGVKSSLRLNNESIFEYDNSSLKISDNLLDIRFKDISYILIGDNSSNSISTTNFDNYGSIISSRLSTIDTGVKNSVIIGGIGLTATSDNTVYVQNLNINNSFDFPNVDGLPGQLLTTDGYGLISWEDNNISIISGSYSFIKDLYDNSELITGKLYSMVDFETIYDQPDYLDANTPKSVVETKSGGITPILLLATSTNTFGKEIWMSTRPEWKFEYDINFTQTEYMGVTAKGRITLTKDEFNNESNYDHDVVLLKRYESVSGSGNFDSFWDTGFSSLESKTFGLGCENNKIGNSYSDFLITNNILYDGCFNNIIKVGSINNILKYSCSNNKLGESCSNNIIENSCNNNIMISNCNSNFFRVNNTILGSWCDSNYFNNGSNNNKLGNYCSRNTFDMASTYNILFDNCTDNIFEDGSDNNILRKNCISNTIKSSNRNTLNKYCLNNFLNYGVSDNEIGCYNEDNYFDSGFSLNLMGDYSANNIFNTGVFKNYFGLYFSNNLVPTGTKLNNFKSDINNIDFLLSTHIIGDYNCEIFKRQDGSFRLSYIDDMDTLIVVGATA